MARVRLGAEPFDPAAELAGFVRGRADVGGVVSFTGLCRADDGVEALELEAYPGFTDAAVAAIVDETAARFALLDVLVVHRTGLMRPGEPIVLVATAAAHRREAFQAADRLMDWLKSRAPFWKKAHGPAGAHWIEPRAADYEDAARWDSDAAQRTSGA